MTKTEIIEEIAAMRNIEREKVSSTLDTFMQLIEKALVNGDHVSLRGFGTFKVSFRKQKVARLISEGKSIVIPEHNYPSFKPAEQFVNRVKATTGKTGKEYQKEISRS